MGLGKLWANAVVSEMERLEAVKLPLEVIAGNPLIPTGKVVVSHGEKPQELVFKLSWLKSVTAKVCGLAWQESVKDSAAKTIVGTVAGAAMGGVGGAVIGAVIGAKTKDASTAVLGLEDETGTAYTLYVRCTGKEYETLQKLLNHKDSQALTMLKGKLG